GGGGFAGGLQLLESRLQLSMLGLLSRQRLLDGGELRDQLLLPCEAMALRCQLAEQVDNAARVGQLLVLGLGVGQLLLRGVVFASQAVAIGKPLALLLELVVFGLQRLELRLLLVMLALQGLALVLAQRLQAAGL